MPDYRIDPERASFDVTTRPGVAGIGARVTGVQGALRASFAEDGSLDLTRPIAGAFSLTVGDLRTGNRWVSTRIAWLDDADQAVMRGWITEVRAGRDPARDGLLELALTVEVGDRTVPLVGSGRLRSRPDGSIEAFGGTLCDPRSFAIPLPPLIGLMVFVRWRLVLEPVPDGVETTLDAPLAHADPA